MALLEVKNLGISFGGLKAVDAFNITIEQGQLCGLIGPNGAGKTTVFNLLTGVYQPTLGTITLDGSSLVGKSPAEICRSGVARTFQNIRLFGKMTVLDNVKAALHNQVKYSELSCFFHGPVYRKKEREMDERAMDILKVFDLDSHADTLASNLPYGQQRKLEIARALATNPKLLLLDEPAAGMNPNETAELMDTIRLIREKYHITILLIEHDMKLVAGICEYLTVLNFGTELASGTPAQVLNDPKVITAYRRQRSGKDHYASHHHRNDPGENRYHRISRDGYHEGSRPQDRVHGAGPCTGGTAGVRPADGAGESEDGSLYQKG